jgi:dTDP-4-amino-4,6-dideoxygalactose transaminase
MERWVELCARHGVMLLEDCAQAHLAAWNGQVAGSFGRVGAYSFYPTKNLGAIGDAGALVGSDEVLMDRALVLRNYGQRVRYEHPEAGLNSRLDELQAALLRVRLEWLDSFTRRRREIAAHYRAGLNNPGVRLLEAPEQRENHVYHLFVVMCGQRESLGEFLRERGIATLIHYPVPVHQQPPCKGIRRDAHGLEASERHAGDCLSIPCHPQMSDADVARVIDAINDFS